MFRGFAEEVSKQTGSRYSSNWRERPGHLARAWL